MKGNYKFTYSIDDSTEDDLEGHEPVSHDGDCPFWDTSSTFTSGAALSQI